MILRRFMQHIKEQNWFAVGLDVIVVIVGIFLGMQVTEWNDARKAKSNETQYLASFRNDLLIARESIQRAVDAHQKLTDEGLKVISYFNGDIQLEDNIEAIEYGLIYQFRFPMPQIKIGELGVLLDRQSELNLSNKIQRQKIIEMVDRINSTLDIYEHIELYIDLIYEDYLFKISPPVRGTKDKIPASYDLESLKDDEKFKVSFQNVLHRHQTSVFMLRRIDESIAEYLAKY